MTSLTQQVVLLAPKDNCRILLVFMYYDRFSLLILELLAGISKDYIMFGGNTHADTQQSCDCL